MHDFKSLNTWKELTNKLGRSHRKILRSNIFINLKRPVHKSFQRTIPFTLLLPFPLRGTDQWNKVFSTIKPSTKKQKKNCHSHTYHQIYIKYERHEYKEYIICYIVAKLTKILTSIVHNAW